MGVHAYFFSTDLPFVANVDEIILVMNQTGPSLTSESKSPYLLQKSDCLVLEAHRVVRYYSLSTCCTRGQRKHQLKKKIYNLPQISAQAL